MLRFGVNYTPSRDWFYSWLSPDWAVTRRDMKALADLGLDHVRIMPLWPVVQPNRTLIRRRALQDIRQVVEIAGEAGLDASVDVLQGHLSGFDFVPSWLTDWHQRSMFVDPDAVAAQAALVEAFDEHLHDLPNFLGLTLGNEVNQFTSALHPNRMPATTAQVTSWLDTLHGAGPRDPRHFRLNAEYDAVWYADDHPFVPTHSSRYGRMGVVHSWIFNGTAQGYGAMSHESVHHAAYLVELSRAFAVDPARPVWLQEVGAPLNHLTEEQAPDFCERTVRAAADSEALWGVTWWCSHDVERRLGDFPDLEYSLGLIDADGRVKPLGRRFGEVCAELRSRPRPSPRREAVVVPVDAADVPVSRAELSPGGGVFETWMRHARAGTRPTLVTSATAADPSALTARGIARLFHAEPTGRTFYSSVSDAETLHRIRDHAEH
ncbi:glycosyl hydrolase [Streptomyces shenzhenensis]|uniref:Glycosyl hydrolase n=1 Tax=Streptomyces shenzhenensis TaxID=943815 RepID=A0A3M0I3V6_9ACTN|nr:glycosyl hydrolase [Streptomyces shenzhenensis]RMB80769.1 glycosyl hydrolase [Streptomyces shenzhenensis]